MDSNFWLNDFNLSTFGGIIGLGFNISSPHSDAFWLNSTAANPQFALSLTPEAGDWRWNQQAPDLSNQSSYLYVGGLDPALNDFLQEDSNQYPVIIVANEIAAWTFEFGLLSFGDPSNIEQ